MDASHPQEKTLEYKDLTIKLKGGPKTSGVLRLTEGKLTGYMVKGKNEVEGVTATVRIEVAGQVIEKSGDFTSVGA